MDGLENNIFASRYVLYMPNKEQLVAQVEAVLEKWRGTEMGCFVPGYRCRNHLEILSTLEITSNRQQKANYDCGKSQGLRSHKFQVSLVEEEG